MSFEKRCDLPNTLRELASGEASGFTRKILKRAADELERFSVMGARGQWTGLLDRNGDRVCIGDTLKFDPREWGDDSGVFEVGYSDGELEVLGTPYSIGQWCRIIKKWSDT